MTEMWAHQCLGVEHAVAAGSFAFLWEVGTGKTRAAIEVLRRRAPARILILSPLITLTNWAREINRYAPELTPHVLYKSGAYRLGQFLRGVSDPAAVFITNYEGLLMDPLFEALVDWRPQILVCDEIHRCKTKRAKRTLRAVKLAKTAKYRLGLTGTCITNSPLDVFSQWLIVDGGEAFGDNEVAFRYNFFYDRNAARKGGGHYFPDWVPKPGAFDQISHLLAKRSMRIKKVECLDLPDLVRKEVMIDLAPEQKRLYEEMKKDFIAVVNSTEVVVAQLAMTKALRLMQIASGFAAAQSIGEDGIASTRTIRLAENPRAAALKDLLEDLTPEHKVIVWAVFKENYDAIRAACAMLGIEAVEVHGDISAKKKQQAVDRFNTDPTCRVLFGHPRSGGIGINLTAASYSIFYSRGFSLEDDIQAESRNHRAGSEIHAKITRIDLVARGTIDEEVTKRLAMKLAISDAVLREIAGAL